MGVILTSSMLSNRDSQLFPYYGGYSNHLYICSVSKIIQDKLWQTILQDTLATEAFMVYNNGELAQGYDIIEKARQHKVISFNGIKLIAQE